ncbi:MAG: hypothetical protein LBM07_03125 [Culturomica sp.]|jgi:hypothetical protein|nr:hypothetical protein [Culturomica sp.]
MENYKLSAFYESSMDEIVAQAEMFSSGFNLNLKYEKLPTKPAEIKSLLNDKIVFCLFNKDKIDFQRLIKYVYAATCPSLLIGSSDLSQDYANLELPIDYKMETKETVAWLNFLMKRSNDTSLELIIPKERDENIRNMVNSNLDFIENTFHKSKTIYNRITYEKGFEKMLYDFMQHHRKGITVMMRPVRTFSFFIPLYLRIYRRSDVRTPLLLIPRDENLYVPCH